MNQEIKYPNHPKKLLFKLGCAGALCRTINYKFNHPSLLEEKATGPLCGGILRQGQQCGMLWGASIAVGMEANRRFSNAYLAQQKAIEVSGILVTDFPSTTKHIDCNEITRCNQTKTLGLIKYLLSGKPIQCKKLVGKWAPKAVEISNREMEITHKEQEGILVNCASLTAEKMGANKEEITMVSGMAGGIGLSGNGCGALAAAIYIESLRWYRENPEKTDYGIPEANEKLKIFKSINNGKIKCSEIYG